MNWFNKIISHYDFGQKPLGLSDSQIKESVFFDGWKPEYLEWDQKLWEIPGKVPCHNLEYNAYHIKRLACDMLIAGKWVGEPIKKNGNKLLDGNHRLRAVKFLWNELNFCVQEPL